MEDKEMLYIQESMVNLLIRFSALESVLRSKGVITDAEYKAALEAVGAQVKEKLEDAFNKTTQTENK